MCYTLIRDEQKIHPTLLNMIQLPGQERLCLPAGAEDGVNTGYFEYRYQ